jgi:molecular chaperone GrpE
MTTEPENPADAIEETPEPIPAAEEALVEDTTRALLEQITELVQERDGLRDQLMRSLADFQNYRKRMETEKQMLRAYATERLVHEILPVVDNFERALATIGPDTTVEQLRDGIESVYKQLLQALGTQNVSKVPTVGTTFDPEVHEALAAEPSEEQEPGTILEELQPGYRMGDRTIRPARVKVAKAP